MHLCLGTPWAQKTKIELACFSKQNPTLFFLSMCQLKKMKENRKEIKIKKLEEKEDRMNSIVHTSASDLSH